MLKVMRFGLYLLLILVLAACGGDDEAEEESGGSATEGLGEAIASAAPMSLENAAEVAPIGTATYHDAAVNDVTFSQDGALLISVAADNTARVLDVATGDVTRTITSNAPLNAVAISPDKNTLYIGGQGTQIQVYNLSNGELIGTMRGHSLPVTGVAIHPSLPYLVSTGRDPNGGLRSWSVDVEAGAFRQIRLLLGHTGIVNEVRFNATGTQFVSVGRDTDVRIYDQETQQSVVNLEGHTAEVMTAAFSPDGTRVASGGLDGTVRLWDAVSGEELAVLDIGQPVLSVSFHPSGEILAVGGGNIEPEASATLSLWNLTDETQILALSGHEQPIENVAFNPAGTLLVSASDDGDLRFWAVAGDAPAEAEDAE